MKNKKFIVASGCSFTSNYKINLEKEWKEHRWTQDNIEEYNWFNWLWKKLGEKNYQFFNYGNITNDNKTKTNKNVNI